MPTRNIRMPDPRPAPKDRRSGGRFRCETLSCELGRVLDISREGAKIRSKWFVSVRCGEERVLRFRSVLGETLPIKVRIVRSEPVGLLTREVGVVFEHMDDRRTRQIAEFARVHSVQFRMPLKVA